MPAEGGGSSRLMKPQSFLGLVGGLGTLQPSATSLGTSSLSFSSARGREITKFRRNGHLLEAIGGAPRGGATDPEDQPERHRGREAE